MDLGDNARDLKLCTHKPWIKKCVPTYVIRGQESIFLNLFCIGCLAISLASATLHTKTYLFVLPERQNLRNNLYSLIRESTLCKLYQGQCWRHGNKHCETTKLNNSKTNLGTKPQNPVSTPIDPVSCDETICLLLCIFPSTDNCYWLHRASTQSSFWTLTALCLNSQGK